MHFDETDIWIKGRYNLACEAQAEHTTDNNVEVISHGYEQNGNVRAMRTMLSYIYIYILSIKLLLQMCYCCMLYWPMVSVIPLYYDYACICISLKIHILQSYLSLVYKYCLNKNLLLESLENYIGRSRVVNISNITQFFISAETLLPPNVGKKA